MHLVLTDADNNSFIEKIKSQITSYESKNFVLSIIMKTLILFRFRLILKKILMNLEKFILSLLIILLIKDWAKKSYRLS